MSKINRFVMPIGIAIVLVTLPPIYVGQQRLTEDASNSASLSSTTAQILHQPGPENAGEMGRPVLQHRYPRYRLKRGDILELTFPFAPPLNQTATVQPDGFIILRILGDLRVEGMTMPELTQLLQTAYAKILREPVLTVDLKDFEKPYFIAAGEVEHPGKYELRGDTTVAQAVAVAGGFRGEAKHSQVLLFRRNSDDWVEVKQLNVKKMLQQANLHEDLHLQPGDMLFVPKTALSKIKSFIPALSVAPYIRPF